MAITFPRDLPSGVRLFVTSFEFDPVGDDAVTQGGSPLIVETGTALWKASFATPPLFGSQYRVLAAWLSTLKTPPQPFWAYDLRRMYPGAYQKGIPAMTRATGGSFDGTCHLASVAGDGVTVGLSILPNNYIASPGDMIAFDYNSGASRALHRIVSDVALANGSGNLTVEVRPVVKLGFSAGATVQLVAAKGKFNIVRSSDKAQSSNTNRTPFTFDVVQTLK